MPYLQVGSSFLHILWDSVCKYAQSESQRLYYGILKIELYPLEDRWWDCSLHREEWNICWKIQNLVKSNYNWSSGERFVTTGPVLVLIRFGDTEHLLLPGSYQERFETDQNFLFRIWARRDCQTFLYSSQLTEMFSKSLLGFKQLTVKASEI